MTERVRLVITDDLHRSRLTVFFRLLLAFPHLLWLILWTIAVIPTALVTWLATLVAGQPPEALHRFLSSYTRYSTHLSAYLFLAANPYPGFTGEPGYPVDLELPDPAPQARWKTAFRLVLALPALLLTAVLGTGLGGGGGGGGSTSSGADPDWSFLLSGGGLVAVCGILGWFAALALGRMPSGLRNLAGYGLGYSAQTYAYLLFLTDAYPSSDPGASGPPWGLPAHSIRVETDDDARRSRLTVLFRFLLALPHLVWLMLWSVLALLAGFVNGVHALVRGRSAAPLHRFLAAYVRYSAHVTAFISIVANRFPGFTGEPGYAVEIAIAPLERQNRWVTLFRGLLAIPAFLVSGALAVVLGAIGFLGWFAALATGRMPTGLRRLGVIAVRYLAQTNAYWLILTDDYPHASPAVAAPGGEHEPVAELPGSAAGWRGGRLTRSSRLARTLGLLALATAWAFAASSLWQTRVPDGLARPDLAARPLFDASLLERAETYERFLRADFVASQLVLLVVLALYAWRGSGVRPRVGGRADRDGDAPRDDRPRARLALAGSLPPRRDVVEPPLRPDGRRLPRNAARELARARRRVPVHLPHARDRDGARRPLAATLVARGSAGVRLPRGALRLRDALPLSDRTGRCDPPAGRATLRACTGDRDSADLGAGRLGLH